MQKKLHKPPGLLYGVNDRPANWTLVILGVEHGTLLITCLMASVFFAQEIGATSSQTISLLNVGLLAGGLTSILQATGKWGIGSGYFCLHTSSYIYFHASLTAAHVGGLPLVFGMTALAGGMQSLLSRVAGKLRVLFPPEVAGLVVAMVGLALAPYAVKSLFGLSGDDIEVTLRELTVGLGTLAMIVGLNVWGNKGLRLYSILAGIIFGYVSAFALGILPNSVWKEMQAMAIFSLPSIEHPGFSFDLRFVVPFLIAAICSSLKLTGDIITCQKINDLDWKRADMKEVQKGINAEGLGSIAAGLLGGTGLAASSSNIGMSYATGATSRLIGHATGIFFIALAFMPKLVHILSKIPLPVVGAVIVYAACFMIVTGWSIVMTRMLDMRRTFVVGISLVMGISVLVVPEIYDPLPAQFKPIFGSSIALTAITAVFLTLIFRIGIARRAVLVLSSSYAEARRIKDFFEDLGGKWGARPEVIHKAGHACAELHEFFVGFSPANEEMRLEVSFDEHVLTVCAEYNGPELQVTNNRPHPDELLEDEKALARLSGFLVTHYADRIKQVKHQKRSRVFLSFEH